MGSFLDRHQQNMRCNAQSLRQPFNGAHRRIAGATFEVADVTALHLGIETKLLLGHASLLPVFPDIETQENDRIHAAIWSRAVASVCILIVSFVPRDSVQRGQEREPAKSLAVCSAVPTGAVPLVMPTGQNMKCNQCNSDNVVKASLAYEMGTSSGSMNSVGVGLDADGLSPMVGRSSGQIQSRLAEKLQPPKNSETVGCGALGVALLIAFGLAYLFDPSSTFWKIVVGLIIPAAIGIPLYVSMRAEEDRKYLEKYAVYNELWVCLRCGHIDKMENFEDE